MRRQASRPFRTLYFASQSFADKNQPSRVGHSSSHVRACHAATLHLLRREHLVAVVYGEWGQRLTTLTRKGRQITIAGLLP